MATMPPSPSGCSKAVTNRETTLSRPHLVQPLLDQQRTTLMDYSRGLPANLLGEIWPAERVAMGVRTCKWLRTDLPRHAQAAVLIGSASKEDTPFLQHVTKSLLLLKTSSLALIWRNQLPKCSREMLAGVSCAVDHGFGRGVGVLEFSGNAIGGRELFPVAKLLTTCRSIKRLVLSRNSFEDRICFGHQANQSMEILAKPLRKLHTLSHLDLSQNNLGVGIQLLSPALVGCSQLNHLDLHSNKIGDAEAVALTDALVELGNLVHLDLRQNCFGALGASTLAQGIAKCSNLKWLGLGANTIGPVGAHSIAQAIASCKNLIHFDMAECCLEDSGAMKVVEALRCHKALTTLNLSKNCVGLSGARSIAKAVRRCTSLAHLNLAGNRFGGEGLGLLVETLSGSPSISSADLSDSSQFEWAPAPPSASVDEECITHKCSCLETLDFGGNRAFSSTGRIRTLCNWIQFSKHSLTHLDLRCSGLQREGMEQLAKALGQSEKLKVLVLRDSNIGPDGARSLAQDIPAHALGQLSYLDLGFNWLRADGMESLAVMLKQCTVIRRLMLNHNQLGTAGAQTLSRVMKGLTTLEHLDVSFNNIGPRDLQGLVPTQGSFVYRQ